MIAKKEELQLLFEKGESGNWNPFFLKVGNIVSYTISTKFPNLIHYHYDPDSIRQECLIKIWNLILRRQLKKDNNIFSYIMGAVIFFLRDVIRKENRRKKKATFVSLEITAKK